MSAFTKTPLTDEAEHEFMSGRSLTWMDVASKSMKVFAKMRALESRLAGMEEALWDIVEPIRKMQRELPDGCSLDGQAAHTLARDAEYLRGIARAALKGGNHEH